MGCQRPSKIRHLGCWAIYALCVIGCPIVTSAAHAAEAARGKRVLIISTGSRLSPGFALVDQGVLEALGKIPSVRVETYAENLDILRFPTERFQRIFKEYLTEKYAEQPPNLIIFVFVGNLGIAGELLQQLFPGTPVIVAGFTEEEVPLEQFGSLVSGIAQRVDPRGTLELIFRLQPEIRRIVVIGGTAAVDRSVLDRVKEAARGFAGRVEFAFWENRSMAELRQAVAALPPQTAILVSRMFRDGAGQAVISTQVGQSIAQWANVPVYVMTDLALGTGAVGGTVGSIEAFGKRAGELARLILTGTAPASLPFEIRTNSLPMFDWRALKRWGISESRLPPNSIVRFRQPSVWEQYRWYILGALFIFALQGAMIGSLLLQRTRRRRVELELQRNREELAHVARLSTAGELTASVAHELNQPLGAILSNAEAAEMFLKADPPALDEVRDILADIRKDDQRASEVIRRMRSLLRKQELAPRSIEINEAVEEVLKLLSIDASARKVAMKFEKTADLPRVCCDPVHFQQVVLNLVLNGMEAMAGIPEGKRQVVLRTGRGDNGTVKVAVADSGHGIPVDRLPRLFEPFFTTKKEGMGMGLSIARTIVEAHHGKIWVENNSETGATFCFTVPVDEGK
jgi:signal transduction histidine kinase